MMNVTTANDGTSLVDFDNGVQLLVRPGIFASAVVKADTSLGALDKLADPEIVAELPEVAEIAWCCVNHGVDDDGNQFYTFNNFDI